MYKSIFLLLILPMFLTPVHAQPKFLHLPWAGNAFTECTQANNDGPTHYDVKTKHDLDFSMGKGTRLYASVKGKAYGYKSNTNASYGGFGWHVKIIPDNEPNYYILTAHMSEVNVSSKGTDVEIGDYIGKSGGVPGEYNSGTSTAAHLHFGLHKGDGKKDGFGDSVVSDIFTINLGRNPSSWVYGPGQFLSSTDFKCQKSIKYDGYSQTGNSYQSLNFATSPKYVCGPLGEICDLTDPTNGVGGSVNSPGPSPLPGPRSDTRPDFDIYNTSGSEISANSDTYVPKTVTVNERIRTLLETQVDNADVKDSLRDKDSNSIEGPIWWKIESNGGTTVRNWTLFVSEEFDVDDLDKGDSPDEEEWFTVPNYPGKTIVFAACTDGDDEVLEVNESTSRKKATSPNSCGTNNRSRDEKLRIKFLKPTVLTTNATTITESTAILNGSVNPRGVSTQAYFDYGKNTNYGTTISLGNIGSINNLVKESIRITGLTCGTAYYYRIRAVNQSGTSYGHTKSFLTPTCPGVTNDIKPVYGFWNPDVTGHHMTISESGKNNLIDKYNTGQWNWRYEGVYFYALPKKINNAVSIYQLWKSGIGHHYTRSSSERSSLLSSGWSEGHTAFYAYPSKRPGTVPVYRYYNRSSTDHFFPRTAPSHYNASCNYTGASLNGKNALNSRNYNHCYEGIGWYAYSAIPKRPSLVTYDANKVTHTSATLRAGVNPQGTSTTLHFDYGETSSYGSTLTYGSVGSGSSVLVREKALGGLSCGKTYQYRARAVNDGGFTFGANKTITMPDCIPVVPTKPNATDGTFQDKVRISWTYVSGATNYRIFRCTKATTSSCKILSTVSGSHYDDNDAKVGTTYYYRLAACNNGGCSNASSYDTGYAAISNYTLSVTRSGNGTVTSDPTGINCGTDCSQSYEKDISITLTAKPEKGWRFERWGGSCSGSGRCVVNMSENKNISAVFSNNSLTNKPNIIPILSLLLLADENESKDEKYRADVNGDNKIDLGDAVLIQRYASGMDMAGTGWVFTPITGDVNCDGKTDIFDATLVQRYGSGLDMAGTGWCVNLP